MSQQDKAICRDGLQIEARICLSLRGKTILKLVVSLASLGPLIHEIVDLVRRLHGG